MRRFRSTSALSFLGALSALLAGCPVWTGDTIPLNDYDGGIEFDARTPDTGPLDDVQIRRDVVTPRDTQATCSSNAQCPAGQVCDANSRQCVQGTLCGANGSCPSGQYCDDRNTCLPGCDDSSQCGAGQRCDVAVHVCTSGCDSTASCQALAADLVCNPTTHQCEQGGQCGTLNPCPSPQVCVSGTCRAPDETCTFDYQCGGKTCVDGRCVDRCSVSNPCPIGQSCTSGFCQDSTSGSCNCTASQICDQNVCRNVCTTDDTCGAGNFCDHGVCRVDDRRPEPFCTPPATGCANNSVCVDGVCRISCASNPTDTFCQSVSFQFTSCDTVASPAVCRLPNESSPQCTATNPCTGGLRCVNGACQ